MKLLFEANGKQKLVEVSKTGGVAPEAVVLWDERVDGLFPVQFLPSVGGLERSGNSLVVNASKLAGLQATEQAAQQQKNQKRNRLQNAKQTLKQLNFQAPLSNAELTDGLKAVFVLLKDLQELVD